jgi:hypothetical protein
VLGTTPPKTLTLDEYAAVPHHDAAPLPNGYPTALPTLLSQDPSAPPTLCARYNGGQRGQDDVEVRVLDKTPGVLTRSDTSSRVDVPAGRGALVRALPAAGVTTGTVYVVTDQGLRYPVGSDADLRALGYADVEPVTIPTTFLQLIPLGATMSAALAGTAVPAAANPGG